MCLNGDGKAALVPDSKASLQIIFHQCPIILKNSLCAHFQKLFVSFLSRLAYNSRILSKFAAVKRISAFLLLCLSGMMWLLSFIISLPFALFLWLKRILVHSK